MILTHIFGECDLDLLLEAKEVWENLFNVCEATGFMPSKEKYGFSVVGPFNISDIFNLEIRFLVEKSPKYHKYYVTKVKAFLTDVTTKELKQKWEIYNVGKNITEAEVPML